MTNLQKLKKLFIVLTATEKCSKQTISVSIAGVQMKMKNVIAFLIFTGYQRKRRNSSKSFIEDDKYIEELFTPSS